jgi:hypothetical protein
MSKDQIKTAVRVANVPADDFERQMASEKPPIVTKLAEQGERKPLVDLGSIKPADAACGQCRALVLPVGRPVEGPPPIKRLKLNAAGNLVAFETRSRLA